MLHFVSALQLRRRVIEQLWCAPGIWPGSNHHIHVPFCCYCKGWWCLTPNSGHQCVRAESWSCWNLAFYLCGWVNCQLLYFPELGYCAAIQIAEVGGRQRISFGTSVGLSHFRVTAELFTLFSGWEKWGLRGTEWRNGDKAETQGFVPVRQGHDALGWKMDQ